MAEGLHQAFNRSAIRFEIDFSSLKIDDGMRNMFRVGGRIELHCSVLAPNPVQMEMKPRETCHIAVVEHSVAVVDRGGDAALRIPTQELDMVVCPGRRIEAIHLAPESIDQSKFKANILSCSHCITERLVRQEIDRNEPTSIFGPNFFMRD